MHEIFRAPELSATSNIVLIWIMMTLPPSRTLRSRARPGTQHVGYHGQPLEFSPSGCSAQAPASLECASLLALCRAADTAVLSESGSKLPHSKLRYRIYGNRDGNPPKWTSPSPGFPGPASACVRSAVESP